MIKKQYAATSSWGGGCDGRTEDDSDDRPAAGAVSTRRSKTRPIEEWPVNGIIAAGVTMPVLVSIEAGTFMMGSKDGPDNERPVHCVRLDAFALAACQTTNAEYAVFLDATGHAPPPLWSDPAFNDPAQPVAGVSWFDAVAYCDWLSGIAGRRYRLPTEAEWERAARGGAEGLRYPWKNTPPERQPGYEERWRKGPARVAGGPPNAFGLYDICENVHEWCADWYSATWYASSSSDNPTGPITGTRRVSRGGSWRHAVKISRCAARSSIPPEFRYADYGFRVAL